MAAGRDVTGLCASIKSSTGPVTPARSEQIALVLSDIDLVQGIISVNKARVSGVDRDKTKTSEDRRVQLCPRALSVLRRHLRLRESLVAAGEIDHEHVFFVETGEPFR